MKENKDYYLDLSSIAKASLPYYISQVLSGLRVVDLAARILN